MAVKKEAVQRSKPDMRVLDEMVQRIINTVNPRRIILFGSASRGELGPDSDLDLLIVMPDGVHRRRTAQMIYKSLIGLGFAKDVVVVTESDVRDHGDNPSLVLCPALQQGTELYHAAG
jgi:predicted nucleotidyltransferase